MMENHDECSLMQENGIMPVQTSLSSQPTWVTYNQQFQAAKNRNFKSKIIEKNANKEEEGDDSMEDEETDMSQRKQGKSKKQNGRATLQRNDNFGLNNKVSTSVRTQVAKNDKNDFRIKDKADRATIE